MVHHSIHEIDLDFLSNIVLSSPSRLDAQFPPPLKSSALVRQCCFVFSVYCFDPSSKYHEQNKLQIH